MQCNKPVSCYRRSCFLNISDIRLCSPARGSGWSISVMTLHAHSLHFSPQIQLFSLERKILRASVLMVVKQSGLDPSLRVWQGVLGPQVQHQTALLKAHWSFFQWKHSKDQIPCSAMVLYILLAHHKAATAPLSKPGGGSDGEGAC